MHKSSKKNSLALSGIFVIGMAFIALHVLQAQVQSGLDLAVPPLQVINRVGYSLCQHKYVSGAYGVVWTSADLGGSSGANNYSIGDIDNDGSRELATVINYQTRVERIKGKKIYYWDQKIAVFEEGCADGNMSSWESPFLGESTSVTTGNTLIADVDNDGDNEFVFVKGSSDTRSPWILICLTSAWETLIMTDEPRLCFGGALLPASEFMTLLAKWDPAMSS